MRPVPVGIDPNIAAFLADIRSAVQQLQQPRQPQPLFTTTTAQLPPASAWKNTACFLSDTGKIAVSDGSTWTMH